MGRINHRGNKLGQSLWRIIYSPNWSTSLCGCQDTCGPALWCGEHVQTPAEIQTQNLCLQKDTPHAKSKTRSVSGMSVFWCVSQRKCIFDESKYVVRVCIHFFFVRVSPNSSCLCDYTTNLLQNYQDVSLVMFSIQSVSIRLPLFHCLSAAHSRGLAE